MINKKQILKVKTLFFDNKKVKTFNKLVTSKLEEQFIQKNYDFTFSQFFLSTVNNGLTLTTFNSFLRFCYQFNLKFNSKYKKFIPNFRKKK